ncbi:MAG: glycosyltransferase family 39 protein [Anaerolineae bacterium]
MKRLLPILAILVLALALRLIAVNTRVLWYDEAFAVLFSEKGVDAMLYGTLTPVNGAAADVHPLLYYTSLNGWMKLFGESNYSVRLWSVILGLGTILAVYLLAKELYEERVALAAALITALAPFHVQYSQEVRMYALLGLLLISATWCFFRAIRTNKLIDWLGFGVLAGLSMYTQQLAAFYLASLGVIPFLLRRRDLILRTVLAAGLALLIYLPWLVNLPAQLGKVGQYWITKPTPVQPLLSLWSFLFVELEVTQPAAVIASIVALTLILVFLALRALPVFRRNSADARSLALILWLLIAPIALMWIVSQLRAVYLTRALQGSALALYIAMGWLATRSRLPLAIRVLVFGAWIIAVGFGLINLYTWNTFPRPRFDLALRTVAADATATTRIIHANKLTMLPMIYYARFIDGSIAQHYIQDVPGSGEDTLGLPTQQALGLLADHCAAEAAGGADQVWFVIFKRQLEELGGVSPEITWLDAHYHRLTEVPINDLLLILYDQPDSSAATATCDG